MAKKRREWKAWAILMPNGKLAWLTVFFNKTQAAKYVEKGEKLIRVLIVEDT